MLAVKSSNVRDNFKDLCDKIAMGETIVISRPQNENIYMINEAEYNELQKLNRNLEYLQKLDDGYQAIQKGTGITKTMEELKKSEFL